MKARESFLKRVSTLLSEANTLAELTIVHEQLCKDASMLCKKMDEANVFSKKEIDETWHFCCAVIRNEYGHRYQEVRDRLRGEFDVKF